jgi:hypothetical protein
LRLLVPALLVAAGLTAAAFLIFDRGEGEGEDVSPGLLPAGWERGINLTAFQPGAYGSPEARRALLSAHSAGADTVALVPTLYMDEADSSSIAPDPAKTPTDESVLAAAATARSLGMRVVIKPHVDVRDGTFRGEIQPEDREAWFASYRRLADHYAELAARAGAGELVVGTELTSMSGDADAWRRIIAGVRDRFDGDVTFAANWVEGAEAIGFWDDLDAIGIDAYMPLGSDPSPSVADLVESWRPYVERMRLLHERWHLPVVFTEVGYESRVGTAARIGQGTAPVSEQAQADAYEAVFEALSKVGFFRGAWWWDWSAEGLGIGPGDGSFSPVGKAAEDVLRRWQGAGG